MPIVFPAWLPGRLAAPAALLLARWPQHLQQLAMLGIAFITTWSLAGLFWAFSLPEPSAQSLVLPDTEAAVRQIGQGDWFGAPAPDSAPTMTDAPPTDAPRLLGVLYAARPEMARAIFAASGNKPAQVLAPGARLDTGESIERIEPRAIVLRSHSGALRRQVLAPPSAANLLLPAAASPPAPSQPGPINPPPRQDM